MNSQIYSIRKIETIKEDTKLIETFIVTYQPDERSLHAIKKIVEKGIQIKNLIVFKYSKNVDVNHLFEELGAENTIIIDDLLDAQKFITLLKEIQDILTNSILYIDISCLNTPEIFFVMKYLKTLRNSQKICVLYSIPFDYHFDNEPFTSYTSYDGDLETREFIGYSGDSEKTLNADLLVFMGFEGAFSFKVIEDINYNEVILVNGLPSFFQKYKDISVINNYDVIKQQKRKIRYVPANNPYEVYNFVEEIANGRTGLCIAPLSTKPVALGVCLYALKNTDVRVVYPTPTLLKPAKTHSVHETLIYDVFL